MILRLVASAAALLLAASPFAAAQSTPAPALTYVGHIAIRTTNMEAQQGFFQKLGFEKAFTIERNGKTAFYFVKINDHEYIEVHPTVSPDGKTHPTGFDHICFESDHAQALFNQWEAAGLKPTTPAPGPDKTLEFGAPSPDGRITEALEVLPESLQTPDKGQHLSANPVSKSMIGADMPVKELEATRKFYAAAGFLVTPKGKAFNVTSKANPGMLSVLRAEAPSLKPQLLFAVSSLPETAQKLSAAGLNFQQTKDRITVLDPDGTPFVFLKSTQ